MLEDFAISIDALDSYESLEAIPEKVRKNAARAINRTADRTRTAAGREIREQVNLPARYVTNNLTLGEAATANNLERAIVGRFRPTSLARFARGTPESTRRAGEVRVSVQPGSSKTIRRAFLIRLKGRGGSTEAGEANIGLAIRLKPGETLRNRKRATTSTSGLTILFGPSIDQLFRTVREDVSPEAADFLEREFSRLMKVDLDG